MSEVKDEVVVLATETETHKGTEITTYKGYQAPLDGSYDPNEAMDIRIATAVATVLKSYYPGYPWKVLSEISQGMIAFQLPELMGPTLHAFIRLKDYNDLSDKLVVETAGNLLERMDLPRGRCDMARYREAKERLGSFQFHDIGKMHS